MDDMARPITVEEAYQIYSPNYFAGSNWSDFFRAVDSHGVLVGGRRRRGPFAEAVKPLGQFIDVVKAKSRGTRRGPYFLLAAFENTHHRKKRDAVCYDRGAVRHRLDACKIELLRRPEDAVIANNIAQLETAAKALEVVDARQPVYTNGAPSRSYDDVRNVRRVFPTYTQIHNPGA